jgi:hypothetical protein
MHHTVLNSEQLPEGMPNWQSLYAHFLNSHYQSFHRYPTGGGVVQYRVRNSTHAYDLSFVRDKAHAEMIALGSGRQPP